MVYQDTWILPEPCTTRGGCFGLPAGALSLYLAPREIINSLATNVCYNAHHTRGGELSAERSPEAIMMKTPEHELVARQSPFDQGRFRPSMLMTTYLHKHTHTHTYIRSQARCRGLENTLSQRTGIPDPIRPSNRSGQLKTEDFGADVAYRLVIHILRPYVHT